MARCAIIYFFPFFTLNPTDPVILKIDKVLDFSIEGSLRSGGVVENSLQTVSFIYKISILNEDR